jgi:hypothetical protein
MYRFLPNFVGIESFKKHKINTMPNWTTNTLMFRGSERDIKSIKDSIFSIDENGEPIFDFNKVIPRPKELEEMPADFISSKIKRFLAFETEVSLDNFKSYLLSPQEGNLTLLPEDFNELTQEIFDKYALLFHNYGHTDWFDWSTDNWGTKWNSDSTNIIHETDIELEIEFLTAWSHPMGIYKKLLDMFPMVSVSYEAQYEGGFGGEIGSWNIEGQYWSIEETREVLYGEDEDGVEHVLHWDDELEEYVNSNGDVYEDYKTKFELWA